MLTTRFRNIVLFIFSKYLIFSIVLGNLDNRFGSLVTERSKTGGDLVANTFHYFMYIVLAIIIHIVIFSLPYYFAFKIANRVLFILTLAMIMCLESIFYVWFNSSANSRNGVIDLLVGILTLLLFFFRPLKQKIIGHK